MQALVWHLNVFIFWMDMIGPIFSGSLVNIVKQFRVWMLLYWSAFNNMLKTKFMGSVCYIVMPSLSVQPFLSDIWCFFLCYQVETFYISHVPVVSPLFLSSELHHSATHQYDFLNLKWATIICEAVSLDIEQILHFCILRAFTGIWHAEHFCKITRLNPEKSGNVRNVYNSKLCYIEHCLYVT